MANIASETEKNPKKRAFFKSFMSCLKVAVVAGLMITALWNSSKDEGAFSAA